MRGFAVAATPRPDWGGPDKAAGGPMLGEVCWLAKPNCRLLGRDDGPPLGM